MGNKLCLTKEASQRDFAASKYACFPVYSPDSAVCLKKKVTAVGGAANAKQGVIKANLARFRVVTDADLKSHIGSLRYYGLADHDKAASFVLQEHQKFNDLKNCVAEAYGLPLEQQRYWTWKNRRPVRPISEQEEQQPVAAMKGVQQVGMYIDLYLEACPKPGSPLPPVPFGTLLIFCKEYDPKLDVLRYVGRVFAPLRTTVCQLLPSLRQLANYSSAPPLEVYKEWVLLPPDSWRPLDSRATLQQSQLHTGDVLCFQRTVSKWASLQYKHPHVTDYLQYSAKRRIVVFKNGADVKGPEVQLELQIHMPYEEVARKLADALGMVPASHGMLCISTSPHVEPCAPHGSHVAQGGQRGTGLQDLLGRSRKLVHTLYYQKLESTGSWNSAITP